MSSLRNRFKKFVAFNQAENNTVQNVTEEQQDQHNKPSSPSDIVYEDDNFRVYVLKTQHKREKRFRLQDSLFLVKIEPKNGEQLPLLSNILDLLHASLLHILDQIKEFYEAGNADVSQIH